MLPSLVLLWARGEAALISSDPSPFNNNDLISVEIGRNIFARKLWSYRFAIPILGGFRGILDQTIEVSDYFQAHHIDEIYPLLLLPNIAHMDNPFEGVNPEHLIRAPCVVDLEFVKREISTAFEQNREINFPILAARYGLLQTLNTMEDMVRDDPASDLREKLDGLAVRLYRPAQAELRFSRLFTKVKDVVGIHALFERLTADPKIWKLVQPCLTEADRHDLLEGLYQAVSLPAPVTNLSFLAQLISEFPHEQMSLAFAKVLPLSFFKDHKVDLQSLLNASDDTLEAMVGVLNGKPHANALSLPWPQGLETFVARTLLHQGDSKIRMVVLEANEVPLDDIYVGITKGMVVDEDGDVKQEPPYFEQHRQLVAGMGGTMDSRAVALACALHPELMLPRNLEVASPLEIHDGMTLGHLVQMWEAALRSQHGRLAAIIAIKFFYNTVTYGEVLRTKNYCEQILQLEEEYQRIILALNCVCLWEAVKQRGLPAFGAKPFIQVESQVDLYLHDRQYIYQSGRNTATALLNALILSHGVESSLRQLSTLDTPLLEVIFTNTIRPSFIIDVFTTEQLKAILEQSTALHPYASQMATAFFENYADNQHALKWKQMHLVFEILPSVIPDDVQLASYLQRLSSELTAEHQFAAEIPHLGHHMYHVLKHRVIEDSLVYGLAGDTFRTLLRRHKVKGTILAVQLEEGNAIDEYLSGNADVAAFEKLLSKGKRLSLLRDVSNHPAGKDFLRRVSPKHFEGHPELQKLLATC